MSLEGRGLLRVTSHQFFDDCDWIFVPLVCEVLGASHTLSEYLGEADLSWVFPALCVA